MLLPSSPANGKTLTLQVEADSTEGRPASTVRYTPAADAPFVLVETEYRNPTDKPVADDLNDPIRADRTFTFGAWSTKSFVEGLSLRR